MYSPSFPTYLLPLLLSLSLSSISSLHLFSPSSFPLSPYLFFPTPLSLSPPTPLLSLLHSLHQASSFLTFNIGSVDSFERNLEQAQRELGIDPANHIPVTYSSEPAWFQNLLINMLPSLLLIGALVYFGRRVSSGSAGRGVS